MSLLGAQTMCCGPGIKEEEEEERLNESGLK